ncbi:MAG: helix-turn-helix domain-containing protein [Sphingobacteriia bacterium]|nr:helix-turn-helix domain-containing protein [Sphingobacteriia bacterium]
MTNLIQESSPDDQKVIDFAESPGRRLRVQRQSRGLSIESVATRLHLRAELIDALEQDRYHALPGPVFVTGYLRNYARLLDLEPDPLIQAYQAHAASLLPIPDATPGREPAAPEDRRSRPWVSLFSLVLIGAVAAMVVLWWQDRAEDELAAEGWAQVPESQPLVRLDEPLVKPLVEPLPSVAVVDDPKAAAVPADTLPPLADDAGASDTATPEESGPAAVTDGLASAQTALVTEPGGPAAEDPISAPAEAPTTGTPGILLEFSAPTWVEVRDVADQRILVGEMKAGDQREVKGQPPFRFTIGRVDNTRMTVDGEPFDMNPYARGNVARFSFDPEADQ